MKKHTHYIGRNMIVGLALGLVIVIGWPTTAEARTGDRVNSAFGVNMHLRQRISPSDWDRVLDRAVEGKVQWGREEFNWDVIEPINNTFTWDAMDAVVAEYEAHNIRMLGLLTYSSEWASSNPASQDSEFYPPDLESWRDYVAQVALRYEGRVDHWEIWNEPNHDGFWKGSVAEYADLLEIAAEEIHEVNPNAKVALGGLSGSDYEFLEDLFEELEDDSIIDVIAIHPYRQSKGSFNYAPEDTADGLNTLVNDIYNIKTIAGRYGHAQTPIWLTEVGYTTYVGGVTSEQQAQYMMRLYTQALAIPKVRKIFWYSFTDTSSNSTYFENKFGMIDEDFDPKTAFSAHQFLFDNLNRKRFEDQSLPDPISIDHFGTSQRWQFRETICTNGTVDDRNGQELRVSYRFTGNNTNCYAPISLRKQVRENIRSVQFRARGEGDNATLRFRITDAKGETFQYNIGLLPNEWLYYNISLFQPSAHWGGDNDAWLDYPITIDSFIIDNKDGEKGSGSLAIDDLIVSPHLELFQYRYKKGGFDTYAVWSADKAKYVPIRMPGVGRITIKRFEKDDRDRNGNTNYRVKLNETIKFLQTR